MAKSDVLNVKIRQARGSRDARRLRAAGQLPAVLYGHGEETISLTVPAHETAAVIRHGGKVVQLQGDLNENAFIRQVQWDGFGTEILHLDLTRVSRGESIETSVPIELRGEAPGAHEGGIVEHVVHDVEIRCPVFAVPEKLVVKINTLELGQSITADQLQLPEGAELLTDPQTVIAHCIEAAAEAEEALAGETAEPEVIGRKAEEEAESE